MMKTYNYYLKGILMLWVFFSIAGIANAQMKLGDNVQTVNGGALLELEATNKGLLYPRVALNQLNRWLPLEGTSAEGMVIYNTNNKLGKGFYFWDGLKWRKFASSGDMGSSTEWMETAMSSGTKLIYAKRAKAMGNDVVVTNDGKLGVGVEDPKGDGRLAVLSQAIEAETKLYAGSYDVTVVRYSNDKEAGTLRLSKARGTFGNPTQLQSGDELGSLVFSTSHNNTVSNLKNAEGAAIKVQLDKFDSPSNFETSMSFSTREDLQQSSTIKMKITSKGNVGIGVNLPAEKLEVAGKVKAENVIFTGIKEFSDNAAAKSAGLIAGEMYRTGDNLKIVHN